MTVLNYCRYTIQYSAVHCSTVQGVVLPVWWCRYSVNNVLGSGVHGDDPTNCLFQLLQLIMSEHTREKVRREGEERREEGEEGEEKRGGKRERRGEEGGGRGGRRERRGEERGR